MYNQFKTVVLCDSQPVSIEGVRSLLQKSGEFTLVDAATTLDAFAECVRRHLPAVLMLDKAFGNQTLLDWLAAVQPDCAGTATVVWGISITEAEALRYLQAGVKGILRKTAETESLLACLKAVAAGSNWMDDAVFGKTTRAERPRSELTVREQQVMELVERGLKNKEIANELGIRPGTVKIHLKHIFEKTGVRGRYGLALSGMKQRQVSRPNGSGTFFAQAGARNTHDILIPCVD
jgi:DNA-binding NarL/FixJ family response regulator